MTARLFLAIAIGEFAGAAAGVALYLAATWGG